MPMSPQEISKRYKRQSLGMPRGTPSSSAKIRPLFKTLYFYCLVCYAFFLEHLYFCFQFYFVLVAVINGWTPTNFFWRRHTLFFIYQEHSSFHSYRSMSVLFFLVLCLAFIFHLDFRSDLVISLYQGVFRPLAYVGFHLKEWFQKGWMVLEKRKKFHAYSGTNGSLFRLWLRLVHVMLDVILIVCLVVFAVAWLVSTDWDCFNVPLKESCVVFIIWEHNIVVFSFDALFGLTWHMLTTCLTSTSCHKPLCMIMAPIALLVGRSQSFVLRGNTSRASGSQKPSLIQRGHYKFLCMVFASHSK
jgi:hypothetical protein